MTLAAIQWGELWVFALLFGLVTVIGFLAPRWRRARTLDPWTSGASAGGASGRS